jgi:hypothetical protein
MRFRFEDADLFHRQNPDFPLVGIVAARRRRKARGLKAP